ncbi:hypothetical protein COT97_00400 [Candidatus Falkowbacteria bacterium CG10_big_fil_rev_8_21_14_0_10_39_11]|uniref:Uncharacterized protein n=1 Tax=Candidatus Falkowbacteria bacterium CG10_big_fil_rev_8_21_14_0_10_39_11 TaxID=1974565 RepID=A0A2H0V698_9BACT|nr:MAG: hypothetical protein COT97_00400 [Candidatus Falkowbacteria bacterium CG10_big_fil_rev_8_21_14_0_10_39_11]
MSNVKQATEIQFSYPTSIQALVAENGSAFNPNALVQSELFVTAGQTQAPRPFQARYARVLVDSGRLFNANDSGVVLRSVGAVNMKLRAAGKPLVDGSFIPLAEALGIRRARDQYGDDLESLLISDDEKVILTGEEVRDLDLDPITLQERMGSGAGVMDLERVARWEQRMRLYEAAIEANSAIFAELKGNIEQDTRNGWSEAICQTTEAWLKFVEAMNAFAEEMGFKWDGTPAPPTPPAFPLAVLRIYARGKGLRFVLLVPDNRHKAAAMMKWSEQMEHAREPENYRDFTDKVLAPLNIMQARLRENGVPQDAPTFQDKAEVLTTNFLSVAGVSLEELADQSRAPREDRPRGKGKRGDRHSRRSQGHQWVPNAD